MGLSKEYEASKESSMTAENLKEEHEYQSKLEKAGFVEIDLEPTRVYRIEDAREFLINAGIDVDFIASQVDGKFMSAFVHARKPDYRS